jgi:hypothetical protein
MWQENLYAVVRELFTEELEAVVFRARDGAGGCVSECPVRSSIG